MPDEALDVMLTATIDEILFEAPDGSFTVARATAEGTREPVTVTGALAGARAGEMYRLSGGFEEHPRYGRQFRIVGAIPVVPSTVQGIRRFLASGRFKGVGTKTADRIVEAFGADAFDRLLAKETEPRVPGVSGKKLREVIAALRDERRRIEVLAFLGGLGLSMRLADRVASAFGLDAVARVRANPYVLATDIDGIGFVTADRVAAALGITGANPLRLRAGLAHVLDLLADDGHVCVPAPRLLRRTAAILAVDEEALEGALDDIAACGIVDIETGLADSPLVYRPDLRAAEIEVTMLLAQSGSREPILEDGATLPAPLPPQLSEEQLDAVRLLLTSPVAVLTGGPGVGKTTVLQAVAHVAEASGKKVVLAAPTGRAARRITETSGIAASTIHRLIGLRPDEGRRTGHPTLRIEADAVIIDEASMLDLKLFVHVLRQMDREASLILVGDKDQLPSVGPGDVLNDLISSGSVPVARLQHIFRQEHAGFIVKNAHRALAGLAPVLPKDGELSDFYFMERADADAGAALIRDLVCTRLPARMGLDPRTDIQVLTPMYRGAAGADNLNAVLQKEMNGNAIGAVHGDMKLHVGDRVIHTKNDYDLDLANGDVGCVVGIDEDRAARVRFGTVVHRFERWSALKLAFALTVHKAQGSEYPAVIVPLFGEHRAMLRRAVIYTAMTRARSLLILVGQPAALALALAESRRDARGSGLRDRLAAAAGGSRRIELDEGAIGDEDFPA